ncbi:ADAMTS-like protein 4, partial [Frankliniella fusca]
RVGCDGVVGSSARPDACGVCAGDNSTCRTVSGIFTRPQLPPGLNVVALLPQGACNLSIAQLRPSRNLLSLRRPGPGGSLLLHAGRGASWSGRYEAGGTRFTYTQADQMRGVGETLSAPGPLAEPLELVLLYQQPNHGIKYEYALPALPLARRELGAAGAPPTALAPPLLPPTTAAPMDNEVGDDAFALDTRPPMDSPESRGQRGKGRRYVWRVTGLTECSKTCGGGTQQAIVQCVRENSLLPVSEKRCQDQDRPSSYPVRCGTRPCPAQWVAGDWSGCSVTCGSGTQTREQSCRQEVSANLAVRVADGACLSPRPEIATVQVCRLPPCSSMHAHHHGHHGHHQHHHHVSHPRPPPPPQRDLQLEGAPAPAFAPATPAPAPAPAPAAASWSVGPWGACSAECGRGVRSRGVTCPSGGCRPEEQPPRQEACDAGPCTAPAAAAATPAAAHVWLASEWSSHCSAECGTGVQSRSVVCSAGPGSDRPAPGAAPVPGCEARLRPAHTRACSAEAASCRAQWFVAPWGPCSATCGQGVQTRGVACVLWQRGQGRYQVQDDALCEPRQRPEPQQPCAERACPPHWYASEWSECSRSCGTGAQKREVRCVGPAGPSTACPEDAKLPTRKACHLQDCPARATGATGTSHVQSHDGGAVPPSADQASPHTSDEPADSGIVCEDRLRNCHIVVQARLCKYSFYGTSCCHSCRRKGE